MPVNNHNRTDNESTKRGSDINDCRLRPVGCLEADDIIRFNACFIEATGKGKCIFINAFIRPVAVNIGKNRGVGFFFR